MKTIFLGMMALLFSLMMAGHAMAEQISIVGTGSGVDILKKIGEAFSAKNSGVVVDVPPSIGSGGGIKAVGTDQAVMGRIARPLKDTEASFGLSYVPFVKIPIVFFTHSGVGIKELTVEQALDIYSGKIDNWKQVGGKDAKIRVIRREDGDSSLEVLQAKFPGFKDIAITAKSKIAYSDQETVQLVVEKPDAIAFGTYANAAGANAAVLSINGKYPTAGDYPYVGECALIFKEANRKGTIAKFVEFAASAAVNDLIVKGGGIPIAR